MPYTPKQLIPMAPAILTTSPVTMYTVPASTSTIIKQIALCNTGGSLVSANVHFIPNGGSALSSNRIVAAMPIPTTETLFFDLTQLLPTSYFISAYASAASAVALWITGVEIT